MTSDPQSVYRSSMVNAQTMTGKCGVSAPATTVSVPKIRYVLHRRPVVYETVTEQIDYIQVPVQYEFEQRDYAQSQQTQCAPKEAPCSAKKSCGC